MLAAVMWDWNGTLLDDVRANFAIVNALLERRSLPAIPFETYRRFFRMPIRDFYADIGFSFEREPFESVAAEYYRRYREAFPQAALTEGAVEALGFFASRGVAQYVVSASHQKDLDEQVRLRGIEKYFERIVGNDDYAVVSKVAKAVALRESLGRVGRILFVGDMSHDFEVARAIGADCALYANGHQAIPESPDYARIERLVDLARFA
jgi:phosphoglycolate phosphatase